MYLSRQGAVHTGHVCNQKCRFCFQRFLDGDWVVTLEKMKADYDYCADMGDDNIYLCGGEPTVAKDFWKILRYMHQQGRAQIGLVTNGMMMANEDFVRRLVDNGVELAHVSYHSYDPCVHDWMTRTPGSHRKVTAALGNMLKHGIRFRPYMCITRSNYRTVPPTVMRLIQSGASMISLSMWDASCWTMLNNREVDMKLNEIPVSQYVAAPFITDALKHCHYAKMPVVLRMAQMCRYPGFEDVIRNWPQTPWSASECNPNTNMWVPYRGNLVTDYDRITMMRVCHVEPFYTRPADCEACTMVEICGGVQKGLEPYDSGGLVPYKGSELVTDPLYFAGDTTWETYWYKGVENGAHR